MELSTRRTQKPQAALMVFELLPLCHNEIILSAYSAQFKEAVAD